MNLCSICQQQFASVEAFDYHLPPPQLSCEQDRLVHPDTDDLVAWGLRQNAKGAWTMKDPGGSLATLQRRHVKARKDIWPQRLAWLEEAS